ncbi:N-acetyltransferase family protein [Acinetobacter sp.]|uniref:GNAT family N-acetyltransferase n=1 Tax=Acinetobacter sp. TaxID=472 RepID=UPI0031CDDBD7
MKDSTQNSAMTLIECNEAEHATAILDIFNEAIANSTALYDYQPRTAETMKNWFATKQKQGLPVIGAIDETGKLLGFASWGTFRAFPAYKYTIEHSIYIHHTQRGRGLGKILLQALIERAKQSDQVHVMIGCIDATNAASIGLHEKLGFSHAGTFKQVGFKFGGWLDAAFYQLILNTPSQPQDG